MTGVLVRWFGFENECRLGGRGVFVCVICDGFFFCEKEIVVVGGGDIVMEEVIFLMKFVLKVYVIYWRDEFRVFKIMGEWVMVHFKIEFIWDMVVIDVFGDDVVLGFVLENLKFGEISLFDVEGVFIVIGYCFNIDFVVDVVDFDDEGYIVVYDEVCMNVRGFFVVGDVFDSKWWQVITVVGIGCRVVIDVGWFIEVEEFLGDVVLW